MGGQLVAGSSSERDGGAASSLRSNRRPNTYQAQVTNSTACTL